jgi:hypothetical protein
MQDVRFQFESNRMADEYYRLLYNARTEVPAKMEVLLSSK